MSGPLAGLDEKVAKLEAAAADCRAATREAHEATKTLRMVEREVRTLLGTKVSELVATAIQEKVTVGLAQYHETLAAAMDHGVAHIGREFKKIEQLFLGPSRRGEEPLLDLAAAVVEKRQRLDAPRDGGGAGMRLCEEHGQGLVAELRDRGLGVLISESVEEAVAKHDASSAMGLTVDNFDPLMGALQSIHLAAVGIGGPNAVAPGPDGIPGCPLCRLNLSHDVSCPDPSCRSPFDRWVALAADQMVVAWKGLAS